MMTSISAAADSQPSGGFSQFDLPDAVKQAVDALQLTEPTPIQQLAIPHLLAGKDMVGLAQTGTGKTAAFVLPLLSHLCDRPPIRKGEPPLALILTPTRELAQQVLEQVRRLAANTTLRAMAVYGGTRYDGQIAALRRGADIIVATPGRLEDLMARNVIDISHIRYFILDEADHMLDLGFHPAITRISEQLPEQRQTMLFSATMPPEIRKLTSRFLTDPVQTEAPKTQASLSGIQQTLVMLSEDEKRDALSRWLSRDEVESCVIFVRTKRKADMLSDYLSALGFGIDALHGDMKQFVRRKVLNKFRDGKIQALVATDVAARGIDIPAISHVFNFDLPESPDAYTHRIGRTGRAGRTGTAISFCSAQDNAKLKQIRKRLTIEPEIVDVMGEPLPAGVAGELPGRKRKPKRQEFRRRNSSPARPASRHSFKDKPKKNPYSPEDGKLNWESEDNWENKPKRKPKKTKSASDKFAKRHERKSSSARRPANKPEAYSGDQDKQHAAMRKEGRKNTRKPDSQSHSAKPSASKPGSNRNKAAGKIKPYRTKFKKAGGGAGTRKSRRPAKSA